MQFSVYPQGSAETVESKTTVKTSNNQENLIHFGDLIDVDVLGSLEYDWRGTLNPEGFLNGNDYLEEPVFGLCRSEDEIASDIVKGYSKLLREPKVVVKIIDSSNRALSILQGAVKKSQRFQIKRPVNLNELLILSGGLNDRVSGEIQIFRPRNLSCVTKTNDQSADNKKNVEESGKFINVSQNVGSETMNVKITDLLSGNLESNPTILSGDIITVLEADPVYIIGGVNNPKQISIRSEITLSRAIASAGGLAKGNSGDLITIFRREGQKTEIIVVDLKKIENGQEKDIILKKLDIVEVGQKGSEKRKFPPVVQMQYIDNLNSTKLPIRIIE